MTPRGIVLHTVGVRGDSTAAAIRKYHVEHNHWLDIGYHKFVRKGGLIENGRPLTDYGAHLEGANDTIGICVAGDGDHEPWTVDQTLAAVGLCVELCRAYGWDASRVVGHREGPARFPGAKPVTKTCPGTLVDMDQVRALVALGLSVAA